MTDLILTSKTDGVVTVRINRPEKKNALTSDMYRDISNAFEAAEEDPEAAAIVILGQPGCFTAGNDIADFLSMATNSGGLGEPVLRFLNKLATLKKPLIAGVDGLAVGVGTTLTLHCDLVYASDQSTFRCPFLDLGLLPEAASTLLGPRLMGQARAFELLCLGEPFDARDAYAAGFVNKVMTPLEVEAAALAAAGRLAAKPPQAMAIARQLLRGDPSEICARLDEENRRFAERLQSGEAREAFTAFMEKRPPNFGSRAIAEDHQ